MAGSIQTESLLWPNRAGYDSLGAKGVSMDNAIREEKQLYVWTTGLTNDLRG